MITITNQTLHIIIAIWSLTFFRSILIMFGSSLFKKASKGEKTAYYPIINLFAMLELVDTSSYLGILLFIPVINVIILILMSYKLGKMFEVSTPMLIGLICLPVVFYPLLYKSDNQYKLRDENYFLALDSVKSDNINLMTEDEVNEMNNNTEVPTNNIDSIFKSQVSMMEEAETYKADRLSKQDLDKINNLSDAVDVYDLPIKRIEKQEPINTSEEINTNTSTSTDTVNKNKFISDATNEDDIEYVDL